MTKLYKIWAICIGLVIGNSAAAQIGGNVDISVIDRTTGKTLQVWQHKGQYYVAGQPNNRYAVNITNRSAGRILTVLSVDGVNVITGQTASAQQSGYVLSPHQSTKVMGWRKSENDVAAFYFTSVSDSYAGRTGRPANTGVIGVALFHEYRPPVQVTPRPTYSDNAGMRSESGYPNPSAAMDESISSTRSKRESKERLGTGHGERLESSITYTEFRRASEEPAEYITIYYDSYDNLVARGIIPKKKRQPVPTQPQAFPHNFVPDPVY